MLGTPKKGPTRRKPGGAFIYTVGETGFEPATPASRTQCSTGLSYSPKIRPRAWPRYCRRTGRDSNPRGLLTPHDFQSCSLSRSDTCPCRGRSPARCQRRGWDSNPREPFGLDGLANRCRNHLATPPNSGAAPSGAPLNCPSWARTRTLLIQSQTCCQLHQGAVSPSKPQTRCPHRHGHQAQARRPEAACPSQASETQTKERHALNQHRAMRGSRKSPPRHAWVLPWVSSTPCVGPPVGLLHAMRGSSRGSSRRPERETGLEPATLSLGS
jgi:hypothetical protein